MHVLCTSKKQNLLAFKGSSALFYSNLTFFLILGAFKQENNGANYGGAIQKRMWKQMWLRFNN